jgi:hypothetical protein
VSGYRTAAVDASRRGCQGFETLAGDIEVPPLTAPIWLEEAKILGEPESPGDAQSRYGLELLAALSRTKGMAGWLRLDPGTP